MSSSNIKSLQTRLNALGADPVLKVDGDFGKLTLAAVEKALPLPAGVATSDTPASSTGTPLDAKISGAVLDARSIKNIQTLHAKVRELAVELAWRIFQEGHQIQIISGTRTFAEQDALYAKGRTAPGSIVTNAKAGYSNHNFGIAFDIGFFRSGKYLDTEVEAGRYPRTELNQLYALAGRIGKSLGLEWGGDWASFKDLPHFQYRPAWAQGMSESAMLAELRRGRAI